MSNILDITPHLPARPALDVELPLQIAKRMHQLNKLSNEAFGLAALVVSRMQAAGEYKCTITRQDLVEGFVFLNGEPFASVTNPEIRDLAIALYQVQAYCGLWNHIKPARVGKATNRYNHFTEKQIVEDDSKSLYQLIQSTTPLYFVWQPEHADDLAADVRRMIENQLRIARWADIQTVKL